VAAQQIDREHMSEDSSCYPAGRLRGSRNRLSEGVICALLRDFREHGQKAIARVPVELDIDIGSGVAGRRLQWHRAFKQEQ
jgi:hypothetical protein